MINRVPIGRFAPSPSGHLHLGSLRTALAAWLFAKSNGGKIYYRVEDIDQGRASILIRDGQIRDLTTLGINFDSFKGQAYMSQSDRIHHYEEFLAAHKDQLFACSCSRKQLAEMRTGQTVAEDFYSGLCSKRGLTFQPRYAVRCQLPERSYATHDLVLGEQMFNPAREHGPFIVRRADGHFAYQLVVVIDDIAMQINQVVRGSDILPSTGIQLFLYELLGAAPPQFAHVPLVLSKQTGKKFSKSEGAADYGELSKRGVTTDRILSFFAHSLGLRETPSYIESPSALLEGFSAAQITSANTFVDLDSLNYWIGPKGPYKI